ncbi:MAG: PAS domain S-box protein [Pseudomonadota bacterium]
MMNSWGIRRRLALLILAVALPLFALSLWSAVHQQQQAIQQASDKLQFSASLVATAQDRITESTNFMLLAVANVPEVRHGTAAQCQRYFDSLRGQAPIYANIGVVDLSGDIRCQTLEGSRAGGNAADRAYFREAIASRGFAAGEYAMGRVSRREVVGFARPVLDDQGTITAIAFAALDLDALAKAQGKAELPAGVRVTITDRNGTVLVTQANSPEVVGQPISDAMSLEALRRPAASAATGTTTGRDDAGQERLYAFAQGDGEAKRWFFVSVSMDRAEVTAASHRAIFLELMGLMVAVIVGMTAAWRIGARHVLQPLQRIVQAARRVARGHLDARLVLPADDKSEFSDISAAFNLMAESLQLRERQHDDDLRQVKSAYELLELVLNSMRDGVLAVNASGNLVLSNECAGMFLDLDGPAPAPGEWAAHYGLYLPGSDRLLKPQEVPLERALAGETVRDVDIDIRGGRHKPVRTVRCSFLPMRSADGIAGAMVVMHDITDLLDLQSGQARSLLAMTELQRKLVEAQQIGRLGNWELDLATGKLWWSDEVHELFGVPKENFDGSLAAMMAVMHPDDRQGFIRLRSRAVRAGAALELEYRVVLPGGEVRWIHQIGRAFPGPDGKPARRAGVVQDITSRKQSDSELLLLRNAVSRLNDVVVMTKADPVTGSGPEIVYVNDAFVKLTGYATAEAIGRTPRFLQGPGTDRAALGRIRQALERRRAVREELVNYTQDGKPYWIEIDISPLRDDRAVVTHFIAVQRDVTARKHAEQALLASERRYAALFEQAPLPMWVSSEDGSAFLAVNEAMEKQYGYSREEFSRLSLYDLRPESEHERLARRLALPASERGMDAYWLHKRKDGSVFEVEVMTTPIGHMGKPAVFAIVNDISARVSAEMEVHRHVLALQRLATASAAIASHQHVQEIAGELAAFAKDIVGCSHAEIRAAAAHPQEPSEVSSLEVPMTGAAGNSLGVLTLSGKINGSFSRLDSYLAVELANVASTAIEKAQLIDEVSALNTGLELRVSQRTKELEAFSYTVSHDLRSPLAAIDGFTKLLARQLGDSQSPKARHYLDRIGAGVLRMGQIIEAMLFLAQISRTQMHWATVDLSAMAREIVAELRETDARRDVSVTIENGLVAMGDSRLMQVVLQNLLANAWKFSSRRAGAAISFTRQSDGIFCVTDNGVGFNMEYSARLFGTFERLHSDSDFPGTGIGLATVKRAVERHSGRIWAESTPGVQTRFFFTLSETTPAAAAESLVPELSESSH